MSDGRRGQAAERQINIDRAGRPGAWGDPYMAGSAGLLRHENNGPRIECGIVVDVVPGAHAYVVSAGLGSFLWCTPSGNAASFGVLGARPLTTYPIGTAVDFVRHPNNPAHGSIVAARAHWSTHTANHPADSIWPFTRTGLQVEAAHQHLLRLSERLAGSGIVPLGSVDAVDFSSGRPPESTSVGEYGAIFETGVGVFADPFQAYIRANEATGVFASYIDDHLMVAGHNYHLLTSICEAEHLDDEGELAGFSSGCVYPHEAMGLWRHNQVTPGWLAQATEFNGLAPGQGTRLVNPYVALGGSGEGAREPEYYTQIPAARKYSWEGYLGQGGASIVAGPVQLDWAYPSVSMDDALSASVAAAVRPDAPSGRMTVNGVQEGAQPLAIPPHTRDNGKDQPGFYSHHITVAGSSHTHFTGRYIVTKRCTLPVPRPVRRPEDPAGDSPAGTYDPSGFNGSHIVKASLTRDTGVVPYLGILLPDVVAFAGWQDLHPFVYHVEDWKVAEEGAAGSTAVAQQTPDYAELAAQQYLAAPTPIVLDVDHRYGLVDFYENESGFAFLEDGSVVIFDGWGSEIRMGGGNIEMRPAADLAAYPGRNLVVLAGHDAVISANDTVDLSAANGDMFLRSQYKFHAIAGNGGCGGFLWECKATCPAYFFDSVVGANVVTSGFTVICPDSAFVVTAQEALIKLTDTGTDSRIVLDAGDDRHVFFRGQTIVSAVPIDGGVVQLFGETGANEFTKDHALIGSGMTVRGRSYFSDCATFGKWVVAGQHFASNSANTYGGRIGQFAYSPVTDDTDMEERFTYLTATYANDFYEQTTYPPNADDAEFTHRNTFQYRTEDFVFWESRWQSLAAAAGQTLWVFTDTGVTGTISAEETYTYPGERRLDSGSYKSVAPTLIDTDNGWVAIPRVANRTDYENADTNTPDESDLDTALAITTPPN